ncbi:MAG: hypothetical protein CSB33_04910 [Desulfobacterales bacterium]|nr:MAG: hypothetical protein CSB33_04910 [Desulfobacterales bacterium]
MFRGTRSRAGAVLPALALVFFCFPAGGGGLPAAASSARDGADEHGAEAPAFLSRSSGPRAADALPAAVLIIDDIGYDTAAVRRLLALDLGLTYSVLPGAPRRDAALRLIRNAGAELMLHLPMEPAGYPQANPGPGAILSDMPPEAVRRAVDAALDLLPDAVGVNNHMGSRIMAMPAVLYPVFIRIRERGLFFIDSRTSPRSVGWMTARLLRLPYIRRDLFLDHRPRPADVRRQLHEMIRLACRRGMVVAIGHPRQATVGVLSEMKDWIRRRVRIMPASSLFLTPAESHARPARMERPPAHCHDDPSTGDG